MNSVGASHRACPFRGSVHPAFDAHRMVRRGRMIRADTVVRPYEVHLGNGAPHRRFECHWSAVPFLTGIGGDMMEVRERNIRFADRETRDHGMPTTGHNTGFLAGIADFDRKNSRMDTWNP